MTAAAAQRRRRVGSVEVLLLGLMGLAVSAGAVSAYVAGDPHLSTAATVFRGVFVQALPLLVLGVVVSGLVAAFVSAERLSLMLPRRPALAVLAAALVRWEIFGPNGFRHAIGIDACPQRTVSRRHTAAAPSRGRS